VIKINLLTIPAVIIITEEEMVTNFWLNLMLQVKHDQTQRMENSNSGGYPINFSEQQATNSKGFQFTVTGTEFLDLLHHLIFLKECNSVETGTISILK
jgi:hypothetical protein